MVGPGEVLRCINVFARKITLKGPLLRERICFQREQFITLTLLHSERPKLYTIIYNFGLSECNRVMISSICE